MKKQILINLFGAAGKRTVEIATRGGFPTRHVKCPREAVPSIFAPAKPKPEQAPATEQKTEQAPRTGEGVAHSSVCERHRYHLRAETSQMLARPQPTLLEVLRWMEVSEDHTDWLIIDEILYVATAHYKMKFNHKTLLNALRFLYREGCLAYRLNRFDQHTFQRIESQENHLKSLLVNG